SKRFSKVCAGRSGPRPAPALVPGVSAGRDVRWRRMWNRAGSPHQLQTELQVAGRVRAGDLAERRRAERRARLAESRRVGERERLESELEPEPLAQPELLVRRKVPVEESTLAEHVPALATERVRQCRHEIGDVEVHVQTARE